MLFIKRTTMKLERLIFVGKKASNFIGLLSLTVCITNTTDPNIRTLKENLLSKYCKAILK